MCKIVEDNKEIRCSDCKGELKPKRDFFNQKDPNGYKKLKKSFDKEVGHEMPDIKGYNCCSCGQAYDEDFKKEKYRIGWL